MTVKEMIDRLETMPPTALVLVKDSEGVDDVSHFSLDVLPVQSLVYIETMPDQRETR
jgi:hypothetical protein